LVRLFSPGLRLFYRKAGNLKSNVFGGEGVFLATVSRNGKNCLFIRVYLLSIGLIESFKHAPKMGDSIKGEGSILEDWKDD